MTDLSPSAELALSKVIVSLHSHKRRIAYCRGTAYIKRPCWGLFVRRCKDAEDAEQRLAANPE